MDMISVGYEAAYEAIDKMMWEYTDELLSEGFFNDFLYNAATDALKAPEITEENYQDLISGFVECLKEDFNMTNSDLMRHRTKMYEIWQTL